MENWVKAVSVTCVLVLYVAEGVNNSVIGPFFPTEATNKGVSQTVIGLISGAFSISNLAFSVVLIFIVTPPTQKFFFCLGSGLSAVTTIAFGYVYIFSNRDLYVIACIILRILGGVGSSMLWATGVPIVIPMYPSLAGRITSLVESAIGVGLMAGPPIGSILYSLGGYELPFLTAGILEVAVTLVCCVALPSKKKRMQQITESGMEISSAMPEIPVLRFITRPGIISISLPMMAMTMSMGFMGVALAIYLYDTFAIGGQTAGLYFMVFAGTGAVTAPLFGLLVDRGLAGHVFATSTFVTSIGYTLLAIPFLANQPASKLLTTICLAILGLSMTGGSTPVYLLFERAALKDNVSEDIGQIKLMVASWLNACFSLGCIAGQLVVGGAFFQYTGFYQSCLLQAAVALITGVAGFSYLLRNGFFSRTYYAIEEALPITGSKDNQI